MTDKHDPSGSDPTANDSPSQAALSGAVERLALQAFEQIDEGHDAFTVAASLSFDSLDSVTDRRADWHHQYDLGAHVRAMVYRDLWDYGWTALHDALSKHDRAQTLGYDPENFPKGADAPHRTTLSRAWGKYFGDELRRLVTDVCQHLREYARETGNLIGSQMLATEDKDDAPARTKARFKRRKVHQMAEQFRDLFYDDLDFNIPDGAHYDKADLLDLFLHMAFSGDFANGGANTWRELVDDEDTTPSGDTLRRYIRFFDEQTEAEVSKMFDKLSDKLWQMADRRGYLDGFVDAAIDGHAWLFYGEDGTPRIVEGCPRPGHG